MQSTWIERGRYGSFVSVLIIITIIITIIVMRETGRKEKTILTYHGMYEFHIRFGRDASILIFH